MDKLQDKIRKLKNPSVVDMSVEPWQLPPHILQESETLAKAYERFCRELLVAMKDIVPAVRFRINNFVLLGAEGLAILPNLLLVAKQQGYYVILDGLEALSAGEAAANAEIFMKPIYRFDAILLSAYIGSDALKPYAAKCAETGRDMFAVIRTANRSARELQDLLTGTRLVHTAAADVITRLGEELPGNGDYSRIGALAAATAPDTIKNLRAKYPNLFLLLDGYDYSGANAKYCSFAFDKFGYGAAACAGSSVTAAWAEEENDGTDFAERAVEAAKRMRNNLIRYVTIF